MRHYHTRRIMRARLGASRHRGAGCPICYASLMPDSPRASGDPPTAAPVPRRLSARARRELLRLIAENLAAEREDAAMYEQLAAQEQDPTRRQLLLKLAASEQRHAQRWRERLAEMGGEG